MNLDALNKIGNAVFGRFDPKNIVPSGSGSGEFWADSGDIYRFNLEEKPIDDLTDEEKRKIMEDAAAEYMQESAEYHDTETEVQYQNFKKAIKELWKTKNKFLDQAEDDMSMYRKAQDIGMPKDVVDNLLYSQDKTGDEVFQMFKQRYTQELLNKVNPKKSAKKVAEKTKEMVVISEELKKRIKTFFRPSRKRLPRAFSLLGNKDTTVPLFDRMFGEWVKQGVKTIIEPYAGAYTLGTQYSLCY